MSVTKKVPYGWSLFLATARYSCSCFRYLSVRLGNSGLKVSKIILGTMQYGDKGWQQWVLEEDEAIEHIKYAFVTF